MKIIFEDKSLIDCHKSVNTGNIVIVISAKDQANPLKKISNACELTIDEFKKLISDIL